MPSGHQGSVSNEKTGYQLPVADYQLPVADYQLLLRHPLGASPVEIADFLNSFKGPHGVRPGISCMACTKIFDSFFACFSILHFSYFRPKTFPKSDQQNAKNRKNPYKITHPV